jgi:hypothetical protein
MKTARAKDAAPQSKRRPAAGRKASGNARSPIPPEARRSTAATLLKHAPGWAGDDLEEVIEIVTRTRAKTRF